MKRRDFFTRLTLGTAAIVAAPRIFSQEPTKALNPYRNVVNNPYYQWVRTKRTAEHVKDNNYWELLSDSPLTAHSWDGAMEYSRKLFKASPKKYIEGGGGYISLCDPPLIRMYCPVSGAGFEYDWVCEYQYTYTGSPITWMNTGDFEFFNQLGEKQVFDVRYCRLLGVGLIPGLIDPFCPNARTVSPVDGYEIHIMYQKIK